MEFSRPEYWSGLLFPSPGDLPNPGMEPASLALQADSLPSEPGKIIRMGPILTQPMVSVFIRREIFHMKTRTHGECYVMTEAGIGVVHPQVKECQGLMATIRT